MKWVERYLRATRPAFETLPATEQVESWFRKTIKNGYPDVELSPRLLRIRSQAMRWEYIRRQGEVCIIADLELSLTLAELNYILGAAQFEPAFSYVRQHALLADAFRRRMNIPHYWFCTAKAYEGREVIGTLRNRATSQQGVSIPSMVALLHELAHLVVDSDHPKFGKWRELSSASLSRFANLADDIASGRTDLGNFSPLAGPSFESLDRQSLQTQLRSYVAAIGKNDALVREVTCDVLATLALLNIGAGVDFFAEKFPSEVPISVREAADAMYQALRTLRSMQFLAALENSCRNLTETHPTDSLTQSLMELVARSNALTHILNHLFVTFLDDVCFVPGTGFDRAPSAAELEAILLRSFQFLAKRSHERLEVPFEAISRFLQTPEDFLPEFQKTTGREFHSLKAADGPGLLEADRLRAHLPL